MGFHPVTCLFNLQNDTIQHNVCIRVHTHLAGSCGKYGISLAQFVRMQTCTMTV